MRTRTEHGQLLNPAQVETLQVVEKMARPERFELPTFWFVAISTFVDLARLTNHFEAKWTPNFGPNFGPNARVCVGVHVK